LPLFVPYSFAFSSLFRLSRDGQEAQSSVASLPRQISRPIHCLELELHLLPSRRRSKSMSQCPEIVATSVTPEKYQTLLTTAKAQGLDLSGVTGSTTFQGMDFTWTYDANGQSLTIQCTGKPIFVPCSMIESRIRALLT
jgi:hypothetical protein